MLALACCAFQSALPLHAAVWTVTTLADGPPGSLRNAVTSSGPGDTIVFAGPLNGTIFLTAPITIANAISILGPGPSKLAVSGNFAGRVFETTATPVLLAGMTIRDGLVVGADGPDGGVGQNGGPGLAASGGAILINSGSLILSNCWVTGNTARGGHGGRGGDNPLGAAFTPGTGGMGGSASGGAIASAGLSYAINCTFSANKAIAGDGGAGGDNLNFAFPESGGTGGQGGYGFLGGTPALCVTNCTFSGNLAAGGAGGPGGNTLAAFVGGQGGTGGNGECGALAVSSSSFSYTISSTIVYNSAIGGTGGAGGNGIPTGNPGTAGSGYTGAICSYLPGNCLPNMGNTIAAENFASTMYMNLHAHFVDLGFNYLGDDVDPGSCIGSLTRMGTVMTPLHPQLKPLANNGGGAPTHAPMQGSPVIDWGYSFGTTTDERRALRPYGTAVATSGGDGSDVGAFEFGSTPLGMGIGGGGVVLSWPACYGDFTLQSATELTAPRSWHDVPDMPAIADDNFVLVLPVTNRAEFFRLRNR